MGEDWPALTLKALRSMVCWSLGGRAARVKMMSALSASKPVAAVPLVKPPQLVSSTTSDRAQKPNARVLLCIRAAGLQYRGSLHALLPANLVTGLFGDNVDGREELEPSGMSRSDDGKDIARLVHLRAGSLQRWHLLSCMQRHAILQVQSRHAARQPQTAALLWD